MVLDNEIVYGNTDKNKKCAFRRKGKKILRGKNNVIQGSAAFISMKNSFILYQIIAVE